MIYSDAAFNLSQSIEIFKLNLRYKYKKELC